MNTADSTGKYAALAASIPMKAKTHAAALADCTAEVCNRSVVTGQDLISALQAGGIAD